MSRTREIPIPRQTGRTMVDAIIPVRVVPRTKTPWLAITLLMLANCAIAFCAGIEFIRLTAVP